MIQQSSVNAFNKSETRMIAMGGRPLMEGFAILGFETWPNASIEDLDKLLLQLIQSGHKAFLLLETYLSQSQSSILTKVRTHGGKIIVTELPAINDAHNFHPFVEDLVIQVLGHQALENEI